MKWIVVLLFAPLVSFAGYGDAGCGLGSVIITKNSKVLQLFVITTNYATGGLTFSMTTGTSNCKVNGIVKRVKSSSTTLRSTMSKLLTKLRVAKVSTLRP